MSNEEFATILNHFLVGVAGCYQYVTREPCTTLRPQVGYAFGRLGMTINVDVVV